MMRWCAAISVSLALGLPDDARAQELTPNYERIRRALERAPQASALVVSGKPTGVVAPVRRDASQVVRTRDSVWNGALIGAGIGAVGGYVWARNICGSNDSECFVISAPVGILGGAGIGAAVGAIADALHR